MASPPPFSPLLCVVDFHHARGPEIEHWIGCPPDSDPTAENDWHLIPYMALPDGAHQSEEEFSYFSLVYKASKTHEGDAQDVEPTSVFGISCCYQMDASQLLWKSKDVTRSAVQKAVVAITDRPQSFSALREKLSVVTRAWFAQRDFRDLEVLQVGGCQPFLPLFSIFLTCCCVVVEWVGGVIWSGCVWAWADLCVWVCSSFR